MRRILAVLALLALAATASIGGSQQIKEFTIFAGSSSTDSTERASAWVPIRGASRVIIRTWTVSASTDTATTDTITAWKTLLSDSICCITSGPGGTNLSAADSVVITGNIGDSLKYVGVYGVPLNRPLKASATGSGRITQVFPISSPGSITPDASTGAVFGVSYLRIRVTPLTRLTTAGFSSTAGLRTVGLNGLRMRAYVIYDNR